MMIDIVIFAAIAAVLVFKLWNVLGKRNGREDDNAGMDKFFSDYREESKKPATKTKPASVKKKMAKEAIDVEYEDYDNTASSEADEKIYSGYASYGSVALGLSAIKHADIDFDPKDFLGGAEAAFEIILNAFVKGDKPELKKLLAKDVYSGFAADIDARLEKGEQISELLIGIDDIKIIAAELRESKIASITVQFRSQQIDARYDRQNVLIDGDPHKSVEKVDVWVFERNIKERDPNWLLAQTEG